jgi:hypothetical protein
VVYRNTLWLLGYTFIDICHSVQFALTKAKGDGRVASVRKYYIIRTYRSGGITPFILNVVTKYFWQFQASPSYPSGCLGRIIRSGRFWLKITFFTLHGIEPEFVGCTALSPVTTPTELLRRLVYLMWSDCRSPILTEIGVKSVQWFFLI